MTHPCGLEPAHSGWWRLLRPLVPAYAGVVAARNLAYTRHWLPIAQLQAPVISVGNLSVGGAGKTPLVICLAELLAARGFAVDVLSRGYGRRSRATEQVSLDPEQATPERYGDEPLLIAQASGVPVYVGAGRYAAGLLAEQGEDTRARVHLLDDGFQHRRLERTVDIVVLHRSDFASSMLPAGRLREPLSSLGRAAVAVLRVEDAACEPELRRRFGHLCIWWVKREIVLPTLAAPSLAFCAIAHPDEFFASLSLAGVVLAATQAFRDHHVWTDGDVAALLRAVRETGARSLLTTEKDLIRMSAVHRTALGQAAALTAVPLCARLIGEEAAMKQLLGLAGLPEAGDEQPA